MKKIIEGWGNYVADKVSGLPKETKEVVEKRLDICQSCAFKRDTPYKRCGKCGCALPQKAYSLSSKCPENKW